MYAKYEVSIFSIQKLYQKTKVKVFVPQTDTYTHIGQKLEAPEIHSRAKKNGSNDLLC